MLFEFSFHLAQLKNVLFFCGLDRKHLRRWNGEGTTTPSKPTTTHWTYIMPIIYSSIEWTKPAFSVGWCAIRVIVLQKKIGVQEQTPIEKDFNSIFELCTRKKVQKWYDFVDSTFASMWPYPHIQMIPISIVCESITLVVGEMISTIYRIEDFWMYSTL